MVYIVNKGILLIVNIIESDGDQVEGGEANQPTLGCFGAAE